ncbi:MAG: TasA family protein [Candidatus Pacebacteria bacterium]|nr:TasA family protein [Candidatus Paceibacterota bacterium]
MKRIILSLSVIAAVAIGAVGATRAYFSDTETSTGNTFSAGKLDLVLGAGNPIPFSVANLYPGQSGTGKVTLTNATGSLNGDLDVKIANMVQSEGGPLTDPEIKAGDYDNGGDLDLSFVIAAYLDVNRNGVFDAGDYQLAYGGQKAIYPGFWGGDFHYTSVSNMLTGWNDIMTMTADQSVDLVVMWQLPTAWTYPAYNQNIIQTDTLGFDVLTSLEQVGGSGGVTE